MPDRYLQLPPITLDAWFNTSVEMRKLITHILRKRQEALDLNDRLHAHLRDDHGVPAHTLDAIVAQRLPPVMGLQRNYQRDQLHPVQVLPR